MSLFTVYWTKWNLSVFAIQVRLSSAYKAPSEFARLSIAFIIWYFRNLDLLEPFFLFWILWHYSQWYLDLDIFHLLLSVWMDHYFINCTIQSILHIVLKKSLWVLNSRIRIFFFIDSIHLAFLDPLINELGYFNSHFPNLLNELSILGNALNVDEDLKDFGNTVFV